MTYKYFLGCVIPGRLPYLEASARKTFEKLGMKVGDQANYSCCPDPTGAGQLDHLTWLALGARNLCLFEESNSNILSLCSGCTETLKAVKYSLEKDNKLKEEINSKLNSIGKKYKGNVEVKHFAQVLYENIDSIKKKVKKPLKDLKVASHPGCHYLRPSEIMQWDDPLVPKTLDELIEAIGADPVDYSLKIDCCGNPVEKSNKDISLLMLENKLKSMKDAGTDCIACVCPACYQQFEFNQKEVNKNSNTNYNFPVFYITELIALAFGMNAEEIGLKYHRVKTDEILQKIS
ncbi:MAG: CoB--CoM heterodisulfide reductase subunit B [Promethearchaeota archaeon]|nr:MAG: CoB--CoM heterodisulfide reductase subunit B [Candidatus Lokiarchaeota archaeon]